MTTTAPTKRTPGSRSSRAADPELAPSRGAFVCRWIERNLVHGEGDFFGQPFRLTRSQKAFIYRCYELRPDGSRRYRRVLKGLPKGNGKTALAAAIGCVELGAAGSRGFPVSPVIPVAAASFDQADLLFGAARTMISEGPLAKLFEVYDTEILRKDGPGRMYRVAAAAGTNDGALPTFFLADEIHEWTGNKERVHLVLANGLAKRAQSWELNTTTAGHDKDTLCGRMYDYGRRVESGEVEDDSFLMDWIEAGEGFDLTDPDRRYAAVLAANPHVGEFVSAENVLARWHQIPQFEWERYYLNRWTAALESWLPAGAWDDCRDESARIPDGAKVVLGVDIGTKKDSSAVVRLHARADGRLVPEAEILTPQGDGTALELRAVEDAIHRMADRYTVEAVVYDKWSFERSAQDLSDRGLLMVEQPMSPERMSIASQELYDAIVRRKVAHAGDPALAAHVKAGATKMHERGWRLVKGKSKRPIDALIAFCLANGQIDSQASVYEDRDMVTL